MDENEQEVKAFEKTLNKEESVNAVQDFIGSVMMELEKTQTRYFLVGILVSFVVSFILYYLYSLIFSKKPVIAIKEPSHKKKKKN